MVILKSGPEDSRTILRKAIAYQTLEVNESD